MTIVEIIGVTAIILVMILAVIMFIDEFKINKEMKNYYKIQKMYKSIIKDKKLMKEFYE